MANHPSAEKRNRQRVCRTNRNKAIRSALRTTLKKARAAVEGGDSTEAKGTVLAAVKALAHAAKQGVIHSRTASRKTSRIQAAAAKLDSNN